MHWRLPGALGHRGVLEYHGHDGSRPAHHPELSPGAARVPAGVRGPPVLSSALFHQQDPGGAAGGAGVPDHHLRGDLLLDGPPWQRLAAGGRLLAAGHRLLLSGAAGGLRRGLRAEGHPAHPAGAHPADALLGALRAGGQDPGQPALGPVPMPPEVRHQPHDHRGVPVCEATNRGLRAVHANGAVRAGTPGGLPAGSFDRQDPERGME